MEKSKSAIEFEKGPKSMRAEKEKLEAVKKKQQQANKSLLSAAAAVVGLTILSDI